MEQHQQSPKERRRSASARMLNHIEEALIALDELVAVVPPGHKLMERLELMTGRLEIAQAQGAYIKVVVESRL